MIVIIDGYNLLKQVFNKLKDKLDKQRKELVSELGFYKNKKYPGIRELVVVFDGGISSHADRQIHNGVVVVYSGYKNSADDWIFEFTKRHNNCEILLVSNDRELISRCMKYRTDPIDVFAFYEIVQNTIAHDILNEFKRKNSCQIIKYEKNVEFDEQLKGFGPNDSSDLDMLMAHADLNFKNEEQRSAYRLKNEKISKKEKRIYRKIKKL